MEAFRQGLRDLGYVEGNLMTHLRLNSQKLKDRAVGILVSRTMLNSEQAIAALEEKVSKLKSEKV